MIAIGLEACYSGFESRTGHHAKLARILKGCGLYLYLQGI
nr:MAG TPA: hypothetical protein [Bacteriophage sp.]